MSELSIFQREQLDEWVALELKKRPNANCGVLAADATLSGVVKGMPSPCISHWEIVESISRIKGGKMPVKPDTTPVKPKNIEHDHELNDLREPKNENLTTCVKSVSSEEGEKTMKRLDEEQMIVLDDWVANALKQYPDATPTWLALEANKRNVIAGIELHHMQIAWSKRRLKSPKVIQTHKPGQKLEMYVPKKHCWRRGEPKPPTKTESTDTAQQTGKQTKPLREPENLDLNQTLTLINRIISDFKSLPSGGRRFVLNQIVEINSIV